MAITRYKDFVLKGLQEESPWSNVKGQIVLGEPRFRDITESCV